jgi:hypothetical protein
MLYLSLALLPLLAIHGVAEPSNQFGGQINSACEQAVS